MTSPTKLSLALAVLAIAGGCSSTPEKPEPAAAMQPSSPEEAAMMAAMEKLAKPGPQHADLMRTVGTWENHYRMHWSPDQPWTETDGKSEITSMLGGRYVMEHVKFDMMGMPMEGFSITGFDNQSGEYISLWADSMSTWWTTSRGKAAPDGTVNFAGTMTDVAGTRPFRMVVKHTADTMHMDMYDTIPPHGEVLVMTVDGKKTGGGSH